MITSELHSIAKDLPFAHPVASASRNFDDVSNALYSMESVIKTLDIVLSLRECVEDEELDTTDPDVLKLATDISIPDGLVSALSTLSKIANTRQSRGLNALEGFIKDAANLAE